MAAPEISPLPPAPLPNDSKTTFNAKAFPFVAALDVFRQEINAFGAYVGTEVDIVKTVRTPEDIPALPPVALRNFRYMFFNGAGDPSLKTSKDVLINVSDASLLDSEARGYAGQLVLRGIENSPNAARTALNVADGATANSTDAQLRNRATHTGTQAISTVAGLGATLDAKLDDSQLRSSLVSPDNSSVPSTLAVASAIADSMAGETPRGAWDASTNTPALASSVGTAGHWYEVSVAGTTDLNGETGWQVGDKAIFNGVIWTRIPANAVRSVDGRTGNVILNYDTPAQSALASLPVGAKYSTKGAVTVGDGGRGDFIVEAASGTPDGYSRVLLANGNHGVLQPVNGVVLVEQFGAVGDYSFTTDTGTDDTTSIQRALNSCLALGASKVLAGKKYLISSALTIPRGVILCGSYVVGGENQTGEAVWPPATDIGSAIVSSALEGPVVLINRSDSYVKDIALAATQARNAALPSSGAQNINCGLAIETDDSPTASLRRSGAHNVLFMYQPADGFYIAGAVASISITKTVSLKCNRHGWAIDCGTLSGRTNKSRPGIIVIEGHRSVNIGGHGYVVGDVVSNTFLLPYRIQIRDYEGFRCGNTPANLLRSAHGIIRGTDIRYEQSASVGTSGTSGEVPTLNHCISINGRNINLFDNRYVHSVNEYIEFWVQGDLKNDGINIFGATLNTFAVPLPNNFIKPTSTITNMVVRGVDYEGTLGVAGDIVDLSAFTSSSNNIEVWQAGEIFSLRSRKRRSLGNAFTTRIITIADDGVATMPFEGTFCHGVAQIAGGTSARGTAKVHFRVGTNAFCTLIDSSGATVGVGTTALTGTTGVDGQLNIAATTDNNLYIENRTGSSTTYVVTLLSINYDNGELV